MLCVCIDDDDDIFDLPLPSLLVWYPIPPQSLHSCTRFAEKRSLKGEFVGTQNLRKLGVSQCRYMLPPGVKNAAMLFPKSTPVKTVRKEGKKNNERKP